MQRDARTAGVYDGELRGLLIHYQQFDERHGMNTCFGEVQGSQEKKAAAKNPGRSPRSAWLCLSARASTPTPST